jgi:predicted nucleic acid-binding protein
MNAVLLDTDVFSYLLKAGDPRADPYRRHVRGKTVAISFVTVGELYSGAEKRNWSAAKRSELNTRLRSVVIVPFDLEVCRAYARLCNIRTDQGSIRTIAANDRWIAAGAIRHNLALVSNNRRHFDSIPGLTLICEAPAIKAPSPVALPLGSDPPRGNQSG